MRRLSLFQSPHATLTELSPTQSEASLPADANNEVEVEPSNNTPFKSWNSNSSPSTSSRSDTGSPHTPPQAIESARPTIPFTPSKRRRSGSTELPDDPEFSASNASSPNGVYVPCSGITANDFLSDEQFATLFLETKTDLIFESDRPREEKILPLKFEIREIHDRGMTYRPGKTAELNDGTFLRITSVLENQDGTIFLSGHRLKRAKSCGSLFPQKLNELVWIVARMETNNESDISPQTSEALLTMAIRVRNVTFTNATYPDFSHETAFETTYGSNKDAETTGRLFCRWKWTEVLRKGKRSTNGSIARLTSEEADQHARLESGELRDQWRGRGKTIPGGSWTGEVLGSIDIENGPKFGSCRSRHTIRKRTFADAFCGCGGVSCGAQQAGYHVEWAYDIDEDKIKTYRANYQQSGTSCYRMSCDEFLARAFDDHMVDHLHLSPPCQSFSPANTRGSDASREERQAPLFSVLQHLETIKPRIATMEETTGLEDRWKEFLDAALNIFISVGYSVEWRVEELWKHGIPQRRKRLLITSAGPGDCLPSFPKPTHGPPGSGLRPYVTIGDAISNIPPNATYHEITEAKFRNGMRRLPYPSSNLALTLTCNGGRNNYHFSGGRHFTNRERACLQGFPTHYSWADNRRTEVTEQIGNAVPPIMAKRWFRSCKQSLDETDRLEALAGRHQI